MSNENQQPKGKLCQVREDKAVGVAVAAAAVLPRWVRNNAGPFRQKADGPAAVRPRRQLRLHQEPEWSSNCISPLFMTGVFAQWSNGTSRTIIAGSGRVRWVERKTSVI